MWIGRWKGFDPYMVQGGKGLVHICPNEVFCNVVLRPS